MEPDSGRTWIERDSNGRFMYVRKRTKLPSTRSLLADAFGISNNPFGRSRSHSASHSHSRSFSRAEARDYLRAQAPVRAPNFLALPAPPTTTTPHPAARMNNTPEGGHAMIHDTGQYSQPPLLNDPNQQVPYPQYPSYTPQYPGYYLAPNHPPHSFQDPYSPLPPGARLLSPPRPATADDLKYKCSICGRFRSPRFHYQHPIPAGQLPAKTVCRKCRQTGTDSDDTSDEKIRLRGLRRSRSVVSLSEPRRTRIVSDGDGGILRRKSSRVEFVSRSRSRHRGRLRRRSISSSSSLGLGELAILEEVHPRRARSRSVGRVVERVRYIEETPPLRGLPPRETIYIDESPDVRRRRASRFEDDYYTDYESEEDYVPRRRVISRAPSLARIARRQFSEPVVREHVRFRTRDFLDGPNSVYEESTVVERPAASRPNVARDVHVLRVSEDEARRIRERLASSDEYELVADRPIAEPYHGDKDWYEDGTRRSRRERRRHRRSRSRVSSVEDIQRGKSKVIGKKPDRGSQHRNSRSSVYAEPPAILPSLRAPSPPSADRRRSTRHALTSRPTNEDWEVRSSRRHEAIDRDGRPVVLSRQMRSRSRSRSRSKSRSGSGWDAPYGGRPPMAGRETVELHERIQGPPPVTEDYDWYDSHGQRVRVREI